MPSAEAFVNPNNSILKYLDFLLPLIEPTVDWLRLSVTHLLIQGGYPCIPRSLFPKFIYLMGRNNGNKLDSLGNSYPTIWTTDLTNITEPRIRWECFISRNVTLHFDSERTGTVVHVKKDEVCLYEAMFRAGLRLPFPRVIRELLSYLHLASQQIMPNAWRVFFAYVVPSGMSIPLLFGSSFGCKNSPRPPILTHYSPL